MYQRRILGFGDRHQIVEVLNTRDRLWGEATWDKAQAIHFCKSIINYRNNIWFGVFLNGELDCFSYVQPFDNHVTGAAYAFNLVVSRKRPDRQKLPNGFDAGVTEIHDFMIDHMEALNYHQWYAVVAASYKPLYENKLGKISTYAPTNYEYVAKGELIQDPVLREVLLTYPKDVDVIVRRLASKAINWSI